MGNMVIVTHHGSRGLGGQLYKRGKAAAERHTKIHSPRTPAHNAWIEPGQTEDDYFEALQIVRQWTRINHFGIHNAIGRALGNKIEAQWWNEHNFVFRKSDGLFYHAKGATPAYRGFAEDDAGGSLIPLNMAQPILLVEPCQMPWHTAMGFAPHGAGRNMSRTQHTKILMEEFGDSRGLGPNAIEAIMKRETKDLDIRFFTGKPDVSELPSAYKNATQVMRAIEHHGLAKITDTIQPLGSIMAGEMNWNRRR
jgi:RNA-splicing ligase RtcB